MRVQRRPGAYRAAFDRVAELENFNVLVGFPAGKPVGNRSRKGSAARKKGADREPFHDMAEIASIALVNDAERPFLSAGIKAGEKQIAAAWQKAAKGVMTLQMTAPAACAMVGEVAVAMVKRFIRDNPHKAISDATAKRKRSRKPLIDTAQMINSVTYKVD